MSLEAFSSAMPPSDLPLEHWSLRELRAALHAGKLSAVELMQWTLERASRTHAQLNAIVAQRDPEALLEDARRAQEHITRGEARTLEGIPLGVKDLEDAAGLPTTKGSKLFASCIAVRDSIQVARLREAGAIVFGKTNTPEFGLTAITHNRLFGTTHNPWHLEHSPGGSSGGSAAALIGGVLPIVTASDGGGSIRIPASWSGAFGLKPHFGRVPAGPTQMWDSTWRTVWGPLTKTVEDAALLLDLCAGPTALDPTALPHPGYRYVDRVREPAPRGLRIGYARTLGDHPVSSEVSAAVEGGLRTLEQLGHRCTELDVTLPALGEDWLLLGAFELAGALAADFADREHEVARWIVAWLERARELTPERYAQALRTRAALCDRVSALFDDVDLLVTPTTPYTAPPAAGPYPSEIEGRAVTNDAPGHFTMPFNFTLQPAASVPVGRDSRGLPIGMQIVGPGYSEDLLLQVCRSFERERPWHPAWPSLCA